MEKTMNEAAATDYSTSRGVNVLPRGTTERKSVDEQGREWKFKYVEKTERLNWQDRAAYFALGAALASLAALAYQMRKQSAPVVPAPVVPAPMPAVDVLPVPAPVVPAPVVVPVAQPQAFDITGSRFESTDQLYLDNEGWLWASGDYTVQATESNFDTVNLHQHWNDGGVFKHQDATIRMDNAAEVVGQWKIDDVITPIGDGRFALLKNGELVQTFAGEVSVVPDTVRIWG